jgi:multidrug efflux pump subunit AcrA (membrane-fusion protein)
MSTQNTSFIHKPKLVIPVVLVIALVAGLLLIRRVGNAPVVNVPSDIATNANVISTNASTNSVALGFSQGGRIASVSVKVGDHVTKGEILASLDTGTAAGAVTQAEGALQLAQAQYASQDVQYANAKTQQDVLVENAYRTLLSSGLAAIPSMQDDSHIPVITGTYTCDTEGSYQIDPYTSGADSGYSFTYSGLESGGGPVTFSTPQPLGSCGLFITFVPGFSGATKWTVSIPNTQSSSYVNNKNAYDLAVTTRDQTLSQYAANLGTSSTANTAKAAVTAAEGVYQSAVANYQNELITAPTTGTVSFVDTDLQVGESATQGKPVISITTQ